MLRGDRSVMLSDLCRFWVCRCRFENIYWVFWCRIWCIALGVGVVVFLQRLQLCRCGCGGVFVGGCGAAIHTPPVLFSCLFSVSRDHARHDWR